MNVTLPSGKVIKGIPDSTSKDEIMQKAIEAGLATHADFGVQAPVPKKAVAPLEGGQYLRIGSYDTGIEMSPHVTEFMAGMGRRMEQIGSLGMAESEPVVDQYLDESGYATAGSIATDIGGMAVGGGMLKGAGALAQGAPKLAKALQFAGQGMQAPTSLGQASAGMGLYGLATNEDRLQGATGGAIGGSLGYGIPKVAGKLIAPKLSKAVQALKDKNVALTTGEMLGGWAKTLEEKLVSIPLAGGVIRGAKHRSIASYGRSVIDDILKPFGKNLPDNVKGGREIIQHANSQISKQYDDILSAMPVQPDNTFSSELSKLMGMAKRLPKKERDLFTQEIYDNIYQPFKDGNGLLLGKTFKVSDSALRTLYKKLEKSQDIHQNNLGKAVRSTHKALLDLGKRQHPELGKALAKADTAYAKMSVVDDAASMLGAETGEFTPAQLLNAIKKNTAKKAFASGQGFNQAETEAAKKAIANQIPNSGTVDRALLAAVATSTLPFNPAVAAPVLAGMAAYSKTGQSALNTALFGRPAGAGLVRGLLEKAAPYTGLLGAVGAGNLTQQ